MNHGVITERAPRSCPSLSGVMQIGLGGVKFDKAGSRDARNPKVSGRARDHVGTGIGLAIVRQAVERMNGGVAPPGHPLRAPHGP